MFGFQSREKQNSKSRFTAVCQPLEETGEAAAWKVKKAEEDRVQGRGIKKVCKSKDCQHHHPSWFGSSKVGFSMKTQRKSNEAYREIKTGIYTSDNERYKQQDVWTPEPKI